MTMYKTKHTTNKFKSNNLTIEERISRLERKLSSKCKFEGTNKFEIFTAEEARIFKKLLNSRTDISLVDSSIIPNTDTWFVLIADDEGDYETTFGIYKINGHIEAWEDDRARYAQVFSSLEECADELMYNYDNNSMSY